MTKFSKQPKMKIQPIFSSVLLQLHPLEGKSPLSHVGEDGEAGPCCVMILRAVDMGGVSSPMTDTWQEQGHTGV